MDSKPLALFNSPDSLIAATVLRKRLGFATELEDGRWLVTANRPMINHRQVVRVVVKQSDAAAVLHEHKRTLARLTDEHGISPVAPTSDDVTVLNRLEQERLRQHFADGDGMLALFGLFKVGPEGDPLVEVVDQKPLAR